MFVIMSSQWLHVQVNSGPGSIIRHNVAITVFVVPVFGSLLWSDLWALFQTFVLGFCSISCSGLHLTPGWGWICLHVACKGQHSFFYQNLKHISNIWLQWNMNLVLSPWTFCWCLEVWAVQHGSRRKNTASWELLFLWGLFSWELLVLITNRSLQTSDKRSQRWNLLISVVTLQVPDGRIRESKLRCQVGFMI